MILIADTPCIYVRQYWFDCVMATWLRLIVCQHACGIHFKTIRLDCGIIGCFVGGDLCLEKLRYYVPWP